MRNLILILALFAALPATAQIVSSTEAPVRGATIELTFPAVVDSFTVTYRPGAVTARTEVFATNGLLTVGWTPKRAGVVQISTDDDSKNLSVRFSSSPILGILVMVVAGVILFGGAAVAMRMLLSDGAKVEAPRFDS